MQSLQIANFWLPDVPAALMRPPHKSWATLSSVKTPSITTRPATRKGNVTMVKPEGRAAEHLVTPSKGNLRLSPSCLVGYRRPAMPLIFWSE
jgi:hypothetical protein